MKWVWIGRSFLAIVLLTIAFSVCADETVDFGREIRPILSDTCFQCHGPDAENRAADLRLDVKDSAFAQREDRRGIVPGNPDASELYRRITSDDPDEQMPPPDSERSLSPAGIQQIKKWIEQGAAWQEHWAFVEPQRPDLPDVSNPDWCRNAIDRFVLARLDQEELLPSAEADKATLLRRVTLDVTGIPPTPEEADAFLADESPDAWERVVDRLLASPRYGERMAVRWLDLARYADTSGYQTDGPRYMWRWRDWVIEAYNSNMPFDQFTTEQIAGDLLQKTPPPGRTGLGGLAVDEVTLNRLIATGFNRNHRGNAEGGVDPDEYQVEYVVDRVDTTATVWLGLTMGCARCHDHKYDPISQKEFYQVFAYFNNVPENGRAIKEGNSPPYVKAPTGRQRRQLDSLESELRQLETRWQQQSGARTTAQTQWESQADASESTDWTITDGLVSHFPFDGDSVNAVPEGARRSGSASENPTVPSAESVPSEPPEFVDGRVNGAAEFHGEQAVDGGDVARFSYFDPFSIAAWVKAEGDGTIVSRSLPIPKMNGYSIDVIDGHVHVNLIQRWLDDCIRVETEEQFASGAWHHVTVTYDGSRQAAGIAVFIDGKPCRLKTHFDFLNQEFEVNAPLRIGEGNQRFRGTIDDVRIYDRILNETEASILSSADSIDQILRTPAVNRTDAQTRKLASYFSEHHASANVKALHQEIRAKRRARDTFVEALPTVMVMSEDATRDTRLLDRGQFDQPKDRVSPGVPAIFLPLPDDTDNNRLSLAKWLTSGHHPLTARVAVNRYWQNFFGEGLVRTTEDFGAQGSPPTHPELLDWLATEFVQSEWNVKHVHKTILTSATYRQSSTATPALRKRDPENELLARGPRFRLMAEMVRDQALSASGLLHEQIGGPSVKPYQPDGIWTEIASDTHYELATGSDLYRRSLYTYWKRTVAPPTMTTFDATPREMCTVRRASTNTPLQALALMNDVTYVEAARALAQRMILEGGDSADDRITRGFRLVLTRHPVETEYAFLRSGLNRYLARFNADESAAKELISVGNSTPDETIDSKELAAYTAVASLILNLDETVTRE